MIAPDITSTSPNFSHVKPSGQGVVIHATRSGVSMNPNELEGTLNWFKQGASQVSSHWVIGRNGVTCRVVSDGLMAWHAGEHNATHWGIELEQGVEADGFTDVQMDALVRVCKGYVQDFGVSPVHSMTGFIGHQQTPQGKRVGKSDPGMLFDWTGFINKLSATPPSMLEEMKMLVDLGYFITHEWDFKDMQPWQKAYLAEWNRRANT